LQKRLDMQSYTYQDHHKYAMRRDGEVYASMFRDVMDSEQEIVLVQLDGTTSKETINKAEIDWSNMQTQIVNDVRKMMFDVYADIGPSFESVKSQNREELKELINGLPPGDPMRNILLNEYLTMLEGSHMEDVRDYARKQLILQGIKKPETPEEEQMLMQAQQNQQPDAQTQALLMEGQARMQEGQAAIMNEENDRIKLQIDQYKADTDRQKVIIEAQKAGLQMRDIAVSTQGKQIDNAMKLRQGVSEGR